MMAAPTGLLDLPPEIILDIGTYLCIKDLNSLVCTSTYFNDTLSSNLYKLGAHHKGRTSPLIWAIQKYRFNVVKRLLENGAEPDLRVNSSTAFHKAISSFNIKALRLLLDHSPPPDMLDNAGWAPLQLAVRRGRLTLLRMILDAHPGIYSVYDEAWADAFRLAIIKDNVRAARLLLENAAKLTPDLVPRLSASSILLAATNGSVEMVQLLVEFGWDIWGGCDINATTPLHVAAEEGYTELIELFLSYGAEVDAVDTQGVTPLRRAVSGQHPDAVQVLLKAGADVHNATGRGSTVLHRCARDGNAEIVQLLLDAGSGVNHANHSGATSLHCALLSKDRAVIRLLIDSGANVSAVDRAGHTPLYFAAEHGDLDILNLLLDRGAHVEPGDSDDNDPLFAAARCGHLHMIKPLIDAGFDINAGIWPPLMTAVVGERYETVRELVNLGANVNFTGATGQTALQNSINHRNHDIPQLLLENGAHVSSLKREWSTVLHEVIRRGPTIRTFELLVEHAGDIHAVDALNRTLLHEAVESDASELLETLLKSGIPVDARDKNGRTALHLLVLKFIPMSSPSMKIRLGAARTLLQHGADVNARDTDGATALHLIASTGYCQLHNMLINAGANVVAGNSFGRTPLHIAANGNKTLFKSMLKKCVKDGLDFMTQYLNGLSIVEEAAMIGSRSILQMIESSGISVTGNNTQDGGYRGTPPLHLAIIYNHIQVATYLAARGADTLHHDLYGRTAVDWLLLKDPSGGIHRAIGRYIPTFTATPRDTQVAILKESVVLRAKETLVKGDGNLYDLAKCLQFLDDTPAVKAVSAWTGALCDQCDVDIKLHEHRHVCAVCPNVDLCGRCIGPYQAGSFSFRSCQGHDFLDLVVVDGQNMDGDVGADVHRSVMTDEKRRVLEGIVKKYSGEVVVR